MAACPQCNRELSKTDSPAGPLPGCDGCGHLWLDATSLDTFRGTVPRRYVSEDLDLLRAESAARQAAAFHRPIVYLRCPGCQKRMLRRTFGEVSYLLMHYCVDHGYWIHRDELEAIATYIARGGEVLESRATRERLEERIRHLEAQGRRGSEQGGGDGFVPFSM